MTSARDSQGSRVDRALVISAHPDDVDFGAAGTVAAWTSAGIEVAYCVCTSGEATGDPATPREEVARLREREQRAAAEVVGVSELHFLGYPDGRLTPSLELRRDLTRVIRAFRPDRVLTWSPEFNWDHIVTSHPDHRAAGEAAFAAVYPDARNQHAHPELLAEGLLPWTVRELWLADGPLDRRDHAVDITDTMAAKMAALRSHKSQTGDADGLEEGMRNFLAEAARRHGLAPGRLAETFQVVHTG
ncbi:PIG-L family deacetylase [Allokutzneria sp. A3M-2-11 16]|uniref:PIG-L deacetylase family protein n=1 Tax=Allokutzneria sp. A3M-2-11 16 TaxID=2962043 RepID=UPI0020B78EEA|nr:PIG-L deacetylase family protein [Allokutzneria sp. A3M-2-11 16]MCP3798794.1 PIG-L family deacetylase [Allokutzneria sp. A3M-2-11 16]